MYKIVKKQIREIGFNKKEVLELICEVMSNSHIDSISSKAHVNLNREYIGKNEIRLVAFEDTEYNEDYLPYLYINRESFDILNPNDKNQQHLTLTVVSPEELLLNPRKYANPANYYPVTVLDFSNFINKENDMARIDVIANQLFEGEDYYNLSEDIGKLDPSLINDDDEEESNLNNIIGEIFGDKNLSDKVVDMGNGLSVLKINKDEDRDVLDDLLNKAQASISTVESKEINKIKTLDEVGEANVSLEKVFENLNDPKETSQFETDDIKFEVAYLQDKFFNEKVPYFTLIDQIRTGKLELPMIKKVLSEKHQKFNKEFSLLITLFKVEDFKFSMGSDDINIISRVVKRSLYELLTNVNFNIKTSSAASLIYRVYLSENQYKALFKSLFQNDEKKIMPEVEFLFFVMINIMTSIQDAEDYL